MASKARLPGDSLCALRVASRSGQGWVVAARKVAMPLKQLIGRFLGLLSLWAVGGGSLTEREGVGG